MHDLIIVESLYVSVVGALLLSLIQQNALGLTGNINKGVKKYFFNNLSLGKKWCAIFTYPYTIVSLWMIMFVKPN